MFMRFLHFVFCLSFLFCVLGTLPHGAQAQSREEALAEKISETTKKKEALDKQAQSLEGKIKKTKKTLISLADDIQKNENEMASLEKDIVALGQKIDKQKVTIDENNLFLSKAILVLQRLGRTPPQTLLLKTGAPYKTAQTTMVIGRLLPSLEGKSRELSLQLEEYEQLSRTLAQKKDQAEKTAQVLNIKQENMTALLEKRQTLYKTATRDLDGYEQDLKKMARESRSLKVLVHKVAKHNLPDRSLTRYDPPRLLSGGGNSRLPISGTILVNYHDKDAFGAPSDGVKIKGRSGALGVAPMGGVVKFTGSFKNYDNLIILEHKDGYHSLIAGLDKVNTSVGQYLEAGEPLGTLGKGNTTLYYELRKNGTPVDPNKKIKL